MVDDILPLRQAKSRNRNLIFGINDSYSHLSSIRHDKLVNGSQWQSMSVLDNIGRDLDLEPELGNSRHSFIVNLWFVS